MMWSLVESIASRIVGLSEAESTLIAEGAEKGNNKNEDGSNVKSTAINSKSESMDLETFNKFVESVYLTLAERPKNFEYGLRLILEMEKSIRSAPMVTCSTASICPFCARQVSNLVAHIRSCSEVSNSDRTTFLSNLNNSASGSGSPADPRVEIVENLKRYMLTSIDSEMKHRYTFSDADGVRELWVLSSILSSDGDSVCDSTFSDVLRSEFELFINNECSVNAVMDTSLEQEVDTPSTPMKSELLSSSSIKPAKSLAEDAHFEYLFDLMKESIVRKDGRLMSENSSILISTLSFFTVFLSPDALQRPHPMMLSFSQVILDAVSSSVLTQNVSPTNRTISVAQGSQSPASFATSSPSPGVAGGSPVAVSSYDIFAPSSPAGPSLELLQSLTATRTWCPTHLMSKLVKVLGEGSSWIRSIASQDVPAGSRATIIHNFHTVVETNVLPIFRMYIERSRLALVLQVARAILDYGEGLFGELESDVDGTSSSQMKKRAPIFPSSTDFRNSLAALASVEASRLSPGALVSHWRNIVFGSFDLSVVGRKNMTYDSNVTVSTEEEWRNQLLLFLKEVIRLEQVISSTRKIMAAVDAEYSSEEIANLEQHEKLKSLEVSKRLVSSMNLSEDPGTETFIFKPMIEKQVSSSTSIMGVEESSPLLSPPSKPTQSLAPFRSTQRTHNKYLDDSDEESSDYSDRRSVQSKVDSNSMRDKSESYPEYPSLTSMGTSSSNTLSELEKMDQKLETYIKGLPRLSVDDVVLTIPFLPAGASPNNFLSSIELTPPFSPFPLSTTSSTDNSMKKREKLIPSRPKYLLPCLTAPLVGLTALIDETCDQLTYMCEITEKYLRIATEGCGKGVSSQPSQLPGPLSSILHELRDSYVLLEHAHVEAAVRRAVTAKSLWIREESATTSDNSKKGFTKTLAGKSKSLDLIHPHPWLDTAFFILGNGLARTSSSLCDISVAAMLNFVVGSLETVVLPAVRTCAASTFELNQSHPFLQFLRLPKTTAACKKALTIIRKHANDVHGVCGMGFSQNSGLLMKTTGRNGTGSLLSSVFGTAESNKRTAADKYTQNSSKNPNVMGGKLRDGSAEVDDIERLFASKLAEFAGAESETLNCTSSDASGHSTFDSASDSTPPPLLTQDSLHALVTTAKAAQFALLLYTRTLNELISLYPSEAISLGHIIIDSPSDASSPDTPRKYGETHSPRSAYLVPLLPKQSTSVTLVSNSMWICDPSVLFAESLTRLIFSTSGVSSGSIICATLLPPLEALRRVCTVLQGPVRAALAAAALAAVSPALHYTHAQWGCRGYLTTVAEFDALEQAVGASAGLGKGGAARTPLLGVLGSALHASGLFSIVTALNAAVPSGSSAGSVDRELGPGGLGDSFLGLCAVQCALMLEAVWLGGPLASQSGTTQFRPFVLAESEEFRGFRSADSGLPHLSPLLQFFNRLLTADEHALPPRERRLQKHLKDSIHAVSLNAAASADTLANSTNDGTGVFEGSLGRQDYTWLTRLLSVDSRRLYSASITNNGGIDIALTAAVNASILKAETAATVSLDCALAHGSPSSPSGSIYSGSENNISDLYEKAMAALSPSTSSFSSFSAPINSTPAVSDVDKARRAAIASTEWTTIVLVALWKFSELSSNFNYNKNSTNDGGSTGGMGTLLAESGIASTVPPMMVSLDSFIPSNDINELGALVIAYELREVLQLFIGAAQSSVGVSGVRKAFERLQQIVAVLSIDSIPDLYGLSFPVPLLSMSDVLRLLLRKVGLLTSPRQILAIQWDKVQFVIENSIDL